MTTRMPSPSAAGGNAPVGVSEAARLLGVTRQTVYRWAARGTLVALTDDPPRFEREQVERLAGSMTPTIAGNGPGTRERILLAAARVIEHSGIGACTMDAVATEAGISRGGVLHHFVDKDDLMLALATAFTSSVDTEWNRRLKDDARMDIASAYIAMTTSPTERYGAAVLLGATAHEAAHRHVAEAVRRWYSRISDESADPGAVARCLAADALWLLATLRADPLSAADRDEVLGALLPPPDGTTST